MERSLWAIHSRNTLEKRNLEPQMVDVPPFTSKLHVCNSITVETREPQKDSHMFPRVKINAGIEFRGSLLASNAAGAWYYQTEVVVVQAALRTLRSSLRATLRARIARRVLYGHL